jgi:hypothetical protein
MPILSVEGWERVIARRRRENPGRPPRCRAHAAASSLSWSASAADASGASTALAGRTKDFRREAVGIWIAGPAAPPTVGAAGH